MIRIAEVKDGGAYRNLIEKLEGESDFLLFGRGERSTSVVKVETMIENIRGQSNSVLLLSEAEGVLNGHATVFGGGAPRNRHVAGVITGVLKEYHGTGVSKDLFQSLLDWSYEQGVERLELSVMVHNLRAVNFYERMGFEKEGVKKRSLIVDGKPVDEFMMARILV